MTKHLPSGLVKLREYMGYDIFVDPETGKFMAELPGGRTLDRAKLEDVQVEIRKLGKIVKIMTLKLPEFRPQHHYHHALAPRLFEVVEARMSPQTYQNTGSWSSGGKPLARYIHKVRLADGMLHEIQRDELVYLYDASIADHIKRLSEEEDRALEALVEKYNAEGRTVAAGYHDRYKAVLAVATPLTKDAFKKGAAAQ